MSEITKHTFSIGESISVPGGNYASYLAGTDSIEIRLVKNGQTVAQFDSALPSFALDMRDHTGTGFAFDHVHITSATAQEIEFGVSEHPISYNRSSGSTTISGAVAVTVAASLAVDASVADSATATSKATVGTSSGSIYALDATRLEAILKADPGNTGVIYITAGTTATTGKGIPLSPGESLTLNYSGAIAAIADNAGESLWATSLERT